MSRSSEQRPKAEVGPGYDEATIIGEEDDGEADPKLEERATRPGKGIRGELALDDDDKDPVEVFAGDSLFTRDFRCLDLMDEGLP